MKIKFSTPILIGAFLLTACAPGTPPVPTPNVAFVETSAAQTVVANFTLTAASWTATPLPAPTDTPASIATPTSGSGPSETPTLLPGGVTATPILCDALTFDNTVGSADFVDVNIPDNTVMQLGQQFVKTWRVKNNGSCTWGAGYKLIYSYGDIMSGKAQALNGVVGPGQEVEVSVQFVAPTKAGTYLSAWQMVNANNKPFPKPVFVKVIVK